MRIAMVRANASEPVIAATATPDASADAPAGAINQATPKVQP